MGLGCSIADDQYWHNTRKFWSSIGMPFELLCNLSLNATLYDIAKSLCHVAPSGTSTFVSECIQKVQLKLDRNINVFIVGHSYGGAVANRICEYFTKYPHPRNRNLHVATFGSIYIPRKRVLVESYNYMLTKDVALRCNGCTPQNCPNLLWLKSQESWSSFDEVERPNILTNVSDTLFGSSAQWSQHNSYDFLMRYLVLHHNLSITPQELTEVRDDDGYKVGFEYL